MTRMHPVALALQRAAAPLPDGPRLGPVTVTPYLIATAGSGTKQSLTDTGWSAGLGLMYE